MDSTKSIRTYEPIGHALGFVGSLRLAWTELYLSRHVIWHLFVRDFVAQFRQKILGYFWIVLGPLLGIVPFVFMNRTGILNPGTLDMPYPIYIFIGMGIWGLLIATFTAVSGGLLGNADLVMRTNIPKIALSITGLAGILYNLIVHVFVLLIVLAIYRLPPAPLAVLYPLAVLPMVLLGVGLGLIFAVVGAVARDVTGMAATALGLLMYLSPVIYKADFSHPLLRTLVSWNPLTHLVETPRSLFIAGVIPDAGGFAAASLFSVLVLALGVHAFYLIKDRVAERL